MPALTFPPEDLDAICHDRFRHPHRESLEAHFLENPPRSASEARTGIERIAGVKRGTTQIRAFPRRAPACDGGR